MIKSKKEGVVNYNKYLKQNDYIKDKELFVTVVPSIKSKPIGKVKIPIKNSGKIKIGQRVNISLDNYPHFEYGILIGKIQYINLVPDSNNEYIIDVRIHENLISSYNNKLDYIPEMQGIAIVITDDLRLVDRFFNLFRNLTKNQ